MIRAFILTALKLITFIEEPFKLFEIEGYLTFYITQDYNKLNMEEIMHDNM